MQFTSLRKPIAAILMLSSFRSPLFGINLSQAMSYRIRNCISRLRIALTNQCVSKKHPINSIIGIQL